MHWTEPQASIRRSVCFFSPAMDKILRHSTMLAFVFCIHLGSSLIISHASPSLFTLNTIKKHHFVLVHGAGHGAWCWYKLMALLESAGHNVTAIDLAACGISPVPLSEVQSIQDYTRPLMELMLGWTPSDNGKKVVLVSHSLGGLPAALAMEAFPEKISLAVFVAAVVFPPDYSLDELFSQPYEQSGEWYDTKYIFDNGPAIVFGRQMLAHRLYQQSSLGDLELATVLLRPTRAFAKVESENVNFTWGGYGSMPRVYAVLGEDELTNKEAEQETIGGAELSEIGFIEGADHMAMMSKPGELFDFLQRVADKYA